MDLEVLKNYRSVPNLSFVSNILERIILKQIEGHLAISKLMDML